MMLPLPTIPFEINGVTELPRFPRNTHTHTHTPTHTHSPSLSYIYSYTGNISNKGNTPRFSAGFSRYRARTATVTGSNRVTDARRCRAIGRTRHNQIVPKEARVAGSLNRVMLLGHLGRDPEARSFQNGGRVVSLRLATSETWKDRDGNKQEKTEWHSVSIFNDKVGEIAEKYLRKGSKCLIEGKLETRKWQDQQGQDRYSTEVVIRPFVGGLTLLDDKGSRSSEPPAGKPAGGGAPLPPSGGSDLDDDIPFAPEWR